MLHRGLCSILRVPVCGVRGGAVTGCGCPCPSADQDSTPVGNVLSEEASSSRTARPSGRWSRAMPAWCTSTGPPKRAGCGDAAGRTPRWGCYGSGLAARSSPMFLGKQVHRAWDGGPACEPGLGKSVWEAASAGRRKPGHGECGRRDTGHHRLAHQLRH